MQHDAFHGARRRVLAGVVGMTLSGGACAQQTNPRNTMAQDSSWHAGTWLNRPKTLAINGDTLDVVTDQATDFWRKTHYGFTRDSEHSGHQGRRRLHRAAACARAVRSLVRSGRHHGAR